MKLKEQSERSQSTANAFSIELKNYATHVRNKQRAVTTTKKQKTLLEKRLTTMLTTQTKLRADRSQRQERTKTRKFK